MKTLLADIGNSSLKVGRLQPTVLATAKLTPSWVFAEGRPDHDPFDPEPANWFCASVNPPGLAALREWLKTHRPGDSLKSLSHDDFDLPINVDFPDRVGVDRLAAAAAAARLKPSDSGAIVVDIGTATTIDAVSLAGEFLGGAILASPMLMLKALNQFTQALPDIDSECSLQVPEPIGCNTESAMRSGAFWGQVGAIRELVRRYQETLRAPVEVMLCGGGVQIMAPLIEPPGSSYPGLVLAGIATAIGTATR